jgi:hypothetical protein
MVVAIGFYWILFFFMSLILNWGVLIWEEHRNPLAIIWPNPLVSDREGGKWKKTWKLCPNSKVANFECQYLSGLLHKQICVSPNKWKQTWRRNPRYFSIGVHQLWQVLKSGQLGWWRTEGRYSVSTQIPYLGLLNQSSQVHTSLSKSVCSGCVIKRLLGPRNIF